MNRIASRSLALVLVVLLLLGGIGFFVVEFVIKAEDWVLFSGSPHIYNGGNIGCGVVVDQNNVLLLDLNEDHRYSNLEKLRMATVHWVGDRDGYISAPALPYYASALVGYDLINGVYNYGQVGGIAKLTLSAAVQTAALEELGEYKGTVAVFNYRTGQLLCAVSTPTYDPDNIPDFSEDAEKYEGVYVNRFTQATYIPGSIFKIVTLAAALEAIPDIEERSFQCAGNLIIDDHMITCEDTHGDQSLKEAFCNSCNCAFAQIAIELGEQRLQEYVEKFGVTDAVTFDGITTAEGNFLVTDAGELDLAWGAIGQFTDLVNPCTFLTFMGAIGNEGKVVYPYVVEEVSVNGNRTYDAKRTAGDRIMSKETAAILKEYLENNVSSKYGAENFPGLLVGAKTGTGEVGGEKKPNAMLAGIVEDEAFPLAFVVCVEDAGYGKTVCIPIASQVLQTIVNAAAEQ